MDRDATVFVVDDDAGVCASLRWLLESDGLAVETYTSARQFLAAYDPEAAGCLILDLRMPDMDGLELQQELRSAGAGITVIFLSGHGDIGRCVQALKQGAVDFIEKPAEAQVVLERVHEAIEADFRRRQREREDRRVRSRIESLTPRERDVLPLLLEGKAIKHVARQLGISLQTAAKHRTRTLQKMRAENETELLRLLGGSPAIADGGAVAAAAPAGGRAGRRAGPARLHPLFSGENLSPAATFSGDR